MAIRIDRNVPIPGVANPGWPHRYPFRQMKPPRKIRGVIFHDSFFVAGKTVHNIGNMCNYYRHQLGFHFVKRAVVERGKKGVRVWRSK